MFHFSEVFSSFSVKDIEKARGFYKEILGFNIKNDPMGFIEIKISGAKPIVIYPKSDHQPAGFTVLNIPVENIDKAVESLNSKGVEFEQYDGAIKTDQKGIYRGKDTEPQIAWFRDPSGNIISILEN
ncbi:VOC family protein [Salegentibacter sp. HM20]